MHVQTRILPAATTSTNRLRQASAPKFAKSDTTISHKPLLPHVLLKFRSLRPGSHCQLRICVGELLPMFNQLASRLILERTIGEVRLHQNPIEVSQDSAMYLDAGSL